MEKPKGTCSCKQNTANTGLKSIVRLRSIKKTGKDIIDLRPPQVVLSTSWH
jgi:hypothetical protein